MLADEQSDMPFCLCWANEDWTRRWDASDHEVLIEQKYLPEDNLNFIKSLVPFFRDKRYATSGWQTIPDCLQATAPARRKQNTANMA